MLLANQHLYYFSEDNARKCQLTLKEMYGHMKANVWVRGGGGVSFNCGAASAGSGNGCSGFGNRVDEVIWLL